VNTGFGATTDTGAANSGFNNTGSGISGFGNTASGASGLGSTNGDISGFFNTGVTGPVFPFPSGLVSGCNSGLLNVCTGVAGLFSLTQRLAG